MKKCLPGHHVYRFQGNEPVIFAPCLCGKERYGERAGICPYDGKPLDDHRWEKEQGKNVWYCPRE